MIKYFGNSVFLSGFDSELSSKELVTFTHVILNSCSFWKINQVNKSVNKDAFFTMRIQFCFILYLTKTSCAKNIHFI